MDYSDIYNSLKRDIIECLKSEFGESDNFQKIAIEIPKNKDHGDLSTNAAMVVSKSYAKKPIDVANFIKDSLSSNDYISEIDIAGPGFINFKFISGFWSNVLSSIAKNDSFGRVDVGRLEKVNIEFVSANPTGPMHIGHARGAIYGDILCRIKEFAGYAVTKEYYLNDAGSQIDVLVKSTHLRYLEQFGEEISIPEGYYPGDYLKDAARSIKDQFGDAYKILDDSNITNFTDIVINKMVDLIKENLSELGIKHDIFFSERELYKPDSKFFIDNSINDLQAKNLIYSGKLPKPKGNVEDWEDREQLLFKSTDFGDDQDRSLTKSDGSYTYFAGDVGYAKTKIDRGYQNNIIILGADHVGYVKRLQAVYNSLSDGDAHAKVILCQIVNYLEDGKQMKMSKRAGSFTTVSDVVKEVGSDVLRFYMVTRKNDIVLDFDLNLVKSQTKENPVFYVQYCQVRAGSVIDRAKLEHADIYEQFRSTDDFNYSDFSKNEMNMIRTLSLFPEIISACAKTNEVQKLANYLYDLAAEFHSFWNFGKENKDYRFIIEDNANLSISRLHLVKQVQRIIRLGLEIMGVSPLSRM